MIRNALFVAVGLTVVVAFAGVANAVTFTAYDDTCWTSGQDSISSAAGAFITYAGTGWVTNSGPTPYPTTSAELLDYTTGTASGVTVTFFTGGSADGIAHNQGGGVGGTGAVGGDALTLFGGKIDTRGWDRLTNYEGGKNTWMIFTGLDPAMTYKVSFFGAYDSSAGDGNVERQIIGATSWTNAPSSGVALATTALTDDTQIVPANNATAGLLTTWTNINPGPDGSFEIRANPNPHAGFGWGPPAWNAMYVATVSVPIPEPATLALLAFGGVGLLARRRRKA